MTSILRALGVLNTPLLFTEEAVPVQDIETAAEKRPRTLKHLIKANHANFRLVLNQSKPNRLSYNLGAAYFLGGSWQLLNEMYEAEEQKLNDAKAQWEDSPSEVMLEDWMGFLGKAEYQRAYIDFFEDQLVGFSYDWKALVHHYLYKAEVPLIYNIIGHDGDPLIQLAFALEISSKTLAIESLARACCEYSSTIGLRGSEQIYSKVNTDSILAEIKEDKTFIGIKGLSTADLPETQRTRIAEYVRRWAIDDGESFESELIKATIYAAAFSSQAKTPGIFDEVVKGAYALRVMLSLQDDRKIQHSLAQQWFMIFLSGYILAGSPVAAKNVLAEVGQSWMEDVKHPVMDRSSTTPPDAFGVIRALEGLSATWDLHNVEFLAAAVRFVENRRI